jgi:hypothetical protein
MMVLAAPSVVATQQSKNKFFFAFYPGFMESHCHGHSEGGGATHFMLGCIWGLL